MQAPSDFNCILPFLHSGVSQVALIVADLESTVENYWKTFGIGDWHFYTYAKPFVKHMSYYGKPADHKFRVALGYFGPSRVELIQHISGETIYRDFIQTHGYGFHHIGLLVPEMSAALQQAASLGIQMIQDGSGFGPDGDGHYAYLDTESLIGITIELIQRPKNRYPPEKIYPPPPA